MSYTKISLLPLVQDQDPLVGTETVAIVVNGVTKRISVSRIGGFGVVVVPGTNTPINATSLGLGNVDNISAVNMPISTLQQAALDNKAGVGVNEW